MSNAKPPRKAKAVSRWYEPTTGKIYETAGLTSGVLEALVRAGEAGVEGLQFPGGTMYRLSARIHQLRKIGLTIVTERVPHNGGKHARYVLVTPLFPLTPAGST